MKTYLSAAALVIATTNCLACDLQVDSAWIREAPSNVSTLAGYAVLSNKGSKPITISSVRSSDFASIEMHESMMANGMATMRALDQLKITPGQKMDFMPNGKHFMMIKPRAPLRTGDMVAVNIKDSTGCETLAQFAVSRDGSTPASMDHTHMNHLKQE